MKPTVVVVVVVVVFLSLVDWKHLIVNRRFPSCLSPLLQSKS